MGTYISDEVNLRRRTKKNDDDDEKNEENSCNKLTNGRRKERINVEEIESLNDRLTASATVARPSPPRPSAFAWASWSFLL